ncbi:MAG: glycosyltransferase, partial [Prevotellaceae bacterium]|nr:glycosyltransferase [Prevotellaceae bacterium]
EYDLQYRYSADFDWCIRCMKAAKVTVNSRLRLVNYLYEGLTTANRKASLKERYAIMCKYYGVILTDILHIWFAVRFYWAKWTKGII